MSNKFPVAIWRPTKEALHSIEQEVNRLREVYQHRVDFIEHVSSHTAEHIREAVLVNDLLTQDLFSELNPDQQEAVEADAKPERDSTDSHNDEEERQELDMSRHEFKQLKEVYKKIQRICHPDKTPHKSLHQYSVRAGILAENGELTELLVLYSIVKQEKAKLDKYSIDSTDESYRYVELMNERDAYAELIESVESQFQNTALYVQDRNAYLDAAMELVVDDIEDTLRVYRSHRMEVSEDLVPRIEAIDANVIQRIFYEEVGSYPSFHTIKSDDSIFSAFTQERDIDEETRSHIKNLFPDED